MKPVVAEHLLSTLLAAGLGAVLFGAGLPSHLLHARVAARERHALLTVTNSLGGVALVPGTAQSKTIGYADTREGCAARASVEVRTALSPDAVLALYSAEGLPRVATDRVSQDRVRVETLQTFGVNPLDWSCWS